MKYCFTHCFTTGYAKCCLSITSSTNLSCAWAHRVSWNGRWTQQGQNAESKFSDRDRFRLREEKRGRCWWRGWAGCGGGGGLLLFPPPPHADETTRGWGRCGRWKREPCEICRRGPRIWRRGTPKFRIFKAVASSCTLTCRVMLVRGTPNLLEDGCCWLRLTTVRRDVFVFFLWSSIRVDKLGSWSAGRCSCLLGSVGRPERGYS